MTDLTADDIRKIVGDFTAAYLQDAVYRLGQIIPGLDGHLAPRIPTAALIGDLSATLEPQEWLTMSLYGARLLDADPAEIREICQSLAEWLFALPGHAAYTIPDDWYEDPLGALWAAALVRAEGDQLITISEAAALAGVSQPAISARIDRGTLRAYHNPASGSRQGRRLVRRSDITAP
jgi:hypothetical protein